MNSPSSITSKAREFIQKRSLPIQTGVELALDGYLEQFYESSQEQELRAKAIREIAGFGTLQSYLDNPLIEEIWINKPNEIHFWDRAGHQRDFVDFSESEIRNVVHRMLRNSSRRIDRSWPFVDAALPDGSRLHVVIPDVTRTNWCINIRKFRRGRITLDELVKLQTITPEQRDQLRAAIRNQKSVLISGATQAGKTTLMTALLSELGDDERLVSAEDTFELALDHSDWVAMQTRAGNSEGLAEISLRELVRQALRMRPSRIAIGEVRGSESLDMLIALNSGIPGICTIHANSARAALRKLLTLPLLAGENITQAFLRPTVSAAFQLAVHCTRQVDGSRTVSEILEVTDAVL